eukprot:17117_1
MMAQEAQKQDELKPLVFIHSYNPATPLKQKCTLKNENNIDIYFGKYGSAWDLNNKWNITDEYNNKLKYCGRSVKRLPMNKAPNAWILIPKNGKISINCNLPYKIEHRKASKYEVKYSIYQAQITTIKPSGKGTIQSDSIQITVKTKILKD